MSPCATTDALQSRSVTAGRLARAIRTVANAVAALTLAACADPNSPERLRIAFAATSSSDNAIDVQIDDGLPSDSLRLRLPSSGLRERTWQPLGLVSRVDDTTFSKPDGEIAGFRIVTDGTEQDRIYPGLVSIGRSFVVNLDYLLPAQSASRIALQARDLTFVGDDCARQKTLDVPIDADRLGWSRGRFIVLTSHEGLACLALASHTVIADAGTPQWLSDHLSKTLSGQLDRLTELFGPVAGSSRPRLVIGYDPDPSRPSSYRGEAGWRSTIFIRFHGTAWNETDPMAEAALASFVTHEAVHLWIGQGVRMASEDRTALMTEGAAEYLSWLLVNDNPRPDAPAAMDEAARRVSNCNTNVGEVSLGNAPLSGRAYYDCGFVVQWLADLETFTRDGTRVHDVWRDLLNSGSQEISLGSFLQASRAQYADAWLTAVSASDRIDAIADSAKGTFEVDRAGAFPARQGTGLAIMHVLEGQCRGGAFGFYEEGDRIRLDTGNRCGPLSGDPAVQKVNGKDVLADTEALLEVVSTACELGNDLTFTGEDDKVVAMVPCSKPLDLPPRPVRIVPVSRNAPPE